PPPISTLFPYTMLFRSLPRLALPERQQDLVPLKCVDARELGRPGTRDPVGRALARRAAGAAAEAADDIDTERRRETHGGVMHVRSEEHTSELQSLAYLV